MNLHKLWRSLWPLSQEAQRVERQLVRKLSMPEEPDYTARLVTRMGFVSFDKPGQLMDYRYTYDLPMVRRVIEIDVKKPLEKELKRARGVIAQRAYRYKNRKLDLQEAQMTGDWDNLNSVPLSEVEELAKMAEGLGAIQRSVKGRSH